MYDVVSMHDEGWKVTRDRASLYNDPTTPQRREKLRRCLADLAPGARVLDYGCGRAEFTEFLASLGFQAFGLDISPQVIAYNRRDFPELEFAQVEVNGPAPYEDGFFDAIWSSEVIEHVYDVHGHFAELARLLRPGGRLILTTPYHGLLKNLLVVLFRFEKHFQIDGQHIRFWTRRSLRQVAAAHGLRPVLWDSVGRVCWLAKSFFCAFEKERA